MWNFADDLGVIIGDHPWIKSKIFPLDQIQNQQFDKWIEELVKSGFISLLSHNGERFYYLPNLTRHQKIDKPNYEKVNIKRADLQGLLSIAEQSPNNRRTFAEQSPPIRVEEGKSRGDGIVNPHTTSDEVVSPPKGGHTPSKIDFSDRKKKFQATLAPFLNDYGRELLNDFFAYWTEPNKSHSKMRFELERTWDVGRRLVTWAKNDKGFAKGAPGRILTYEQMTDEVRRGAKQEDFTFISETKMWRRK
jgi:hypothetical protein